MIRQRKWWGREAGIPLKRKYSEREKTNDVTPGDCLALVSSESLILWMVGDHLLCIQIYRLQISLFQTGQIIAITITGGEDAWGTGSVEQL